MTSEAVPITPEPSKPAVPVVESTTPSPTPFDFKRQVGRWTRFVLASNPFYILSAVMILWSMDRLSLDSKIFTSEMPQLYFNVSAFQIYELLLVITAIFLAGRGIWYDSGLLVGLENLFIAVPFILVSQVLLTESPAAVVLCFAGCVMGLVRIGALKRYVAGIQMPRRLLAGGAVLLIANLAMPMLMRSLHKDVNFAIWYDRAGSLKSLEWLVLAPLCVGMGFFLPKPRKDAAVESAKTFFFQPYFPVCALLFWAAGTLAHFYSIGYVYGFKWQVSFLVPAVWMTAWVLWNRAEDFMSVLTKSGSAIKRMLSLGPVAVLVWAMEEGDWQTCMVLAAANGLVYGWLALQTKAGWERQLCLISLAMAFAAAPVEWAARLGVYAGRFEMIAGGIALYLVVRVLISRNPRMGILGAILVPCVVGSVLPDRMIPTDFALVQLGIVFFLLHSLRWDDGTEWEAGKARVLALLFWLGNSLLWLGYQPATGGLGTAVSALAVLGVYGVARMVMGRWGSRVLPLGAFAVLCLKLVFLACKVTGALFMIAGQIPIGLVILGSGFGMFALGTLVALTRAHWNAEKSEATARKP